MRLSWLAIALTGMLALCVQSCSVQRRLRSDVRSQMYEVTRDTVREQVMVAVHDTLTITKTITIRENEQGDTVFRSEVTDRDRIRSKADVRSKKEVVRVERDTVYIERRDSVDVRNYGATESQSRGTALHRTLKWILLKWIFWILCAIVVLVITVRIGLRRSLF